MVALVVDLRDCLRAEGGVLIVDCVGAVREEGGSETDVSSIETGTEEFGVGGGALDGSMSSMRARDNEDVDDLVDFLLEVRDVSGVCCAGADVLAPQNLVRGLVIGGGLLVLGIPRWRRLAADAGVGKAAFGDSLSMASVMSSSFIIEEGWVVVLAVADGVIVCRDNSLEEINVMGAGGGRISKRFC